MKQIKLHFTYACRLYETSYKEDVRTGHIGYFEDVFNDPFAFYLIQMGTTGVDEASKIKKMNCSLKLLKDYFEKKTIVCHAITTNCTAPKKIVKIMDVG